MAVPCLLEAVAALFPEHKHCICEGGENLVSFLMGVMSRVEMSGFHAGWGGVHWDSHTVMRTMMCLDKHDIVKNT